MILPEGLAGELEEAAASTYITPSLLSQAIVHEFIARGSFEPNLRRMNAELKVRRDAMLAALERYFPRESRWAKPEGGMAVWVRLPEGLNANELLAQAQAQGIYFTPGPRFYASGSRSDALRLSFTTVTPAQIEAGVKSLGKLVEKQMASDASARATRSVMVRKALV